MIPIQLSMNDRFLQTCRQDLRASEARLPRSTGMPEGRCSHCPYNGYSQDVGRPTGGPQEHWPH